MSAAQPSAPANRTQPRQIRVTNLDRQVCRLRFSPCGQFLAAGGYDATVRRWGYAATGLTALPHLTGHHGWVTALAFHPDRRRLFTADSWGELRCWTFTERTPPPPRVTAAAHEGWIHNLAIAADGRLVATCGQDGKVRLWSAETGQRVRELTGHENDVYSVAFHPDGRTLASGDLRGDVILWEVASGRRLRTLDCRSLSLASRLQDVGGVRGLAYAPDGRTLACWGTRPTVGGNVQGTPTAYFFEGDAARPRHTLSIGGTGDGYMGELAFRRDGSVVAVTSGNPGTGKFFVQRPGEPRPQFVTTAMPNCHTLAVHPEGRRLIIAATNSGSNGNGRPTRNGQYPGNFSPLHEWELPAT